MRSTLPQETNDPTDQPTYKPKSSSLIAKGLCFVRSPLLAVPFSNRCTGCSTIFFFTFCCTVCSIHLRPHSPLHYNLAPCAILIHTKIDETRQRRFHRLYSFFFVSAPASSLPVRLPLTFSYTVSYKGNESDSSSTTLTASSSSPTSSNHSAEVRVLSRFAPLCRDQSYTLKSKSAMWIRMTNLSRN